MLNDITKFVKRDEKTFEYYLVDNKFKHFGINNIQTFLDKDNKIILPFVTQIVQEAYPFIYSKVVKQEIIDKSIEQGNCVHEMIDLSIKNQNTNKLNLFINECNNQNHIQIAKRIITELNNFMYKFKIKKIYSEKSFLYIQKDLKFIGTIDLILESDNQVFIIDIKTSRINYLEKYYAQLFLYKKLFEFNTNKKVTNMFILNPRELITWQEYKEINKKTEYILYEIINQIFTK